MYDENKIFDEFLDMYKTSVAIDTLYNGKFTRFYLTPIPDEIKAEWVEGLEYYISPLIEGDSLLWDKVIVETLNNLYDLKNNSSITNAVKLLNPRYDLNWLTWYMQETGILHAGEWDGKVQLNKAPIDENILNQWLKQALINYSRLFNRLKAAGVPLVNER